MHVLQAVHLLVGLLLDLLGHAYLLYALAQLLELLLAGFVLAQLGLDGLELLAQEELLLGLIHALLGHVLDLALQRGHLHLFHELLIDLFQALYRILTFQDGLGCGRLHPQIGGYKIRQPARLLHAVQDTHDL